MATLEELLRLRKVARREMYTKYTKAHEEQLQWFQEEMDRLQNLPIPDDDPESHWEAQRALMKEFDKKGEELEEQQVLESQAIRLKYDLDQAEDL